MSWLQQTNDGVQIRVKLVPRASVNRIDGPHGDALKIRLNAPPVDGKANAALLRFLADELDLPLSSIALTAGETSRQKTFRIRGATADTIRAALSRD